MSSLTIDGREIGPGRATYVVAELSANHHQSLEQAVTLVHAAKEAGADAVKLQTYTPDTITIDSDCPSFRHSKGSLWSGRALHELYSEAYMPWEWQPELGAIADSLGLTLFSAAFDPTAVDFLERMGVPAHKVASFEVVDVPLIEKMARTNKPLIISTGMATFSEVKEAVEAARSAGSGQIALLKCTSAYPAPPEEMNLRTIPHMAEQFRLPIGLSDHTNNLAVAVGAVAVGACIVEKHLTLSRSTTGPDSAFSLEPEEFREMVNGIRTVEKALGEVRYGTSEQEAQSRVFRRSLYVVKDVKVGEVFSEENVRSIRPGDGLPPKNLGDVLERRAARDIRRGTPLAWSLVK